MHAPAPRDFRCALGDEGVSGIHIQPAQSTQKRAYPGHQHHQTPNPVWRLYRGTYVYTQGPSPSREGPAGTCGLGLVPWVTQVCRFSTSWSVEAGVSVIRHKPQENGCCCCNFKGPSHARGLRAPNDRLKPTQPHWPLTPLCHGR